jgi:hypothetical protein
MQKFKQRIVYYEAPNGDNIALMRDVSEKQFNDFVTMLKRKYGKVPELGVIKEELINF